MAYIVQYNVKSESQIQPLRQEYKRFEELEKAIVWFLERTPRAGITIDIGQNSRIWVTDNLPADFPKLRMIYMIEDHTQTVTILSIENHLRESHRLN